MENRNILTAYLDPHALGLAPFSHNYFLAVPRIAARMFEALVVVTAAVPYIGKLHIVPLRSMDA